MNIRRRHPANSFHLGAQLIDGRGDSTDDLGGDFNGDKGAQHGRLRCQEREPQPVECGLGGALNDAFAIGQH